MDCQPLTLKWIHSQRLREVYRSAGWPYQDIVEIELLAAGLLERVNSATGHEVVRVTDSGIQHLANATQGNLKLLGRCCASTASRKMRPAALVRALFVSSGDIACGELAITLTINIHRMATPAQDKALGISLADLINQASCHPQTGAKVIFLLV